MRKKQNTTEKDWKEAIERIEDIVSLHDLDSLVGNTLDDIHNITNGRKVAYVWSGGKDSIVLGMICEMAGIHESVFVHSDLEYSSFMDWVLKNKPDGCEMINTGQDMEWLSRHTGMLFPQSSEVASKWFHLIQHKGQEMYYDEHGLEMIILGRRLADGNYCGDGGVYANKNLITRYSPLYKWRHEDVLAFLHYYLAELPPIYGWKNGYLCGTHAWPARQWTGSIINGWKEVYEIEPEILEKASPYFEDARRVLNGEA